MIAILITITVLDLHVPRGTSLGALGPVAPVAITYLLSFAYLGIYWNEHHHMLQVTERVNGTILWANLHLPRLAAAIGRDVKGRISPVIYAVSVPMAFLERWVAFGGYVVVALLWIVPDRRLESRFEQA